jgi:catechol 2,3-dioxygenase-like lactoylglutathione lyase family enzyme
VLQSVAAITFLIPSYDEGISFSRDRLGFRLFGDTSLGQDKRWVVVAAAGGRGATLIVALPRNRRGSARIGDQTGGRLGYFLLTDDFETNYADFRARGIQFLE